MRGGMRQQSAPMDERQTAGDGGGVFLIDRRNLKINLLHIGNRIGPLPQLSLDAFFKQIKILLSRGGADVNGGDHGTGDRFSIDQPEGELIADPGASFPGVKLDITAHLLKFVLPDLTGVADSTDNLTDQTDIDIAILFDSRKPDAKRGLLSGPYPPGDDAAGAQLHRPGADGGRWAMSFSKRMKVRFGSEFDSRCGGGWRVIEQTLKALAADASSRQHQRSQRHGEHRQGFLVTMSARSLHSDIMPRPTGLIQQLDQHLHRSRLFRRREHVLIACSGGSDSVALAHLLADISRSDYWQWKLRLVHVNHRTRGRENDLDREHVRRLAQQLRIPVNVATLRARIHPQSENELREARWEKIMAVARRYRCTCVVTAHHADDQAETVLLRLLRGAGIRGLGAMAPVRRAGPIRIVRPLLTFEKRRLADYLRQRKVEWREDSSNQDRRHLRNRIRAEMMPLLCSCQPQIASILSNTAAQMRRVDRFMSKLVQQSAAEMQIQQWNRSVRSLPREKLRSMDAAILTLLLRRWLIGLGVSADRLNYTKLDHIRRCMMQKKSGTFIELEGGKAVCIERVHVRYRAAGKLKRTKRGN